MSVAYHTRHLLAVAAKPFGQPSQREETAGVLDCKLKKGRVVLIAEAALAAAEEVPAA